MPSICEEKTFTSIFREYSETLHNYLYYKTGSQDVAYDLTQEAFTRLWQNCASVLFNSAKGYVFKTANNLLLNQYGVMFGGGGIWASEIIGEESPQIYSINIW